MDLGRIGIWSFQLEQQPAARSCTAAAEIERLGYGALWIPEALGREIFTHAALLLAGTRTLDHIESGFENLASVRTNGVDGGASYTLDSRKRGMGDFGTFVIGVQGTFINSYLIDSPRALREYYRVTDDSPRLRAGRFDYSNISATYEAAGE